MEEDVIDIESGLNMDDFVHDRRTLRVKMSNGDIHMLKKYRDGRIVGFSDSRFSFAGSYREYELNTDFMMKIEIYLCSIGYKIENRS